MAQAFVKRFRSILQEHGVHTEGPAAEGFLSGGSSGTQHHVSIPLQEMGMSPADLGKLQAALDRLCSETGTLTHGSGAFGTTSQVRPTIECVRSYSEGRADGGPLAYLRIIHPEPAIRAAIAKHLNEIRRR